jgi:hypothetical protein
MSNIKCCACGVSLLKLTVVNLDAEVSVRCSCGTPNLVVGTTPHTVPRTQYRHPRFVTGSDEDRYKTLFGFLRSIDRDLDRLTPLRQAISSEKDRLWKIVQPTFSNRFQADEIVETLGADRVAAKLQAALTPEQIEALIESIRNG